ncbi:hypothetical protein D9Q98_000387 [Chlorella vulgaris]|uniref:Histidine phosphatase family protein n=1 Tax=Chlorella vulgaris TaxID=3077 RepID=A0A9D4TY65_CHLVU|nr:hypothetical protein D9Q98_000387 [Chlorella vulgaris]
MLKVLLVRHAQCEMNLHITERIGGRTNHSPLTELGEQQARAVASHLRTTFHHDAKPAKDVRFFSSTAVRAVETAKAVMAALEVEDGLVQSEQLLELEQGEFEGAVRRECFPPELIASFAADPWGVAYNFAPPRGESQRQVEVRMLAFLQQQVLPQLLPHQQAVVVGHGMAFKCLLRGLLGSVPTMTRNIALGNTSVTEIGFVPGKGSNASSGEWHILRVNDRSHLPDDLRS